MHNELIELLTKFEKEITQKIAQKLHELGTKHYKLMAVPDMYPRVKKIFNSLLDSIKNNNIEIFINYTKEMGIGGFKEGYGLEDLQSNLNYLAECLWEVIGQNLENKIIPEALESVNKRIFQAKDKLASVYIEKCFKMEEKLLHLKKEFEDFLKTRDIK